MGILARVILQVRILNDAVFALGMLHGSPNGGSLAAILGMSHHPHPRIRDTPQSGGGSVGGCIVNHNDFKKIGSPEDAPQDGFDRLGLVVDGHHHGEFHGVGVSPAVWSVRRRPSRKETTGR